MEIYKLVAEDRSILIDCVLSPVAVKVHTVLHALNIKLWLVFDNLLLRVEVFQVLGVR